MHLSASSVAAEIELRACGEGGSPFAAPRSPSVSTPPSPPTADGELSPGGCGSRLACPFGCGLLGSAPFSLAVLLAPPSCPSCVCVRA